MDKEFFWQNFRLGKELDIALSFIYDGLLEFDRLEDFNNQTEVFKCLYNLSVGFERLLKVGIVLKEFQESTDINNFEKSLITHNTSVLFSRLTKGSSIAIGNQHKEFLSLLSYFYKTSRYNRFILQSNLNSNENIKLLDFLLKNIKDSMNYDDFNRTYWNNHKIKKFLGKIVAGITNQVYELIEIEARKKNIYTYELTYDSKAFKLIMNQNFNFYEENIIKKEILLYLLNNQDKSAYKDFLSNIQPLDLDIALINDYLQSLFGEVKSAVRDEIDYLFESQVNDTKSRLEILDAIGHIGNTIDFCPDEN